MHPVYSKRFKLLNFGLFLLLLGVLYLNFFYKEGNELSPVRPEQEETASLSKATSMNTNDKSLSMK